MHRETRQAALPACGRHRGLSIIRKPGNKPGQAPVGGGGKAGTHHRGLQPQGMPARSRGPREKPHFSSPLTTTQSSPRLPRGMLAPVSLSRHARCSQRRLHPPITQPAAERQAAASLPVYVFCWGTCRACLANEKLLWIPRFGLFRKD